MGKFDGILICTDLDGTLLRSDRSISQENLDAIEYFKSEGGYFTFITGRMPYFSKMIYDAVGANAPVGCVNGGGIYDYEKGEYLWLATLSDSVIELVEHVDKNVDGIGINLNTPDKVYFCRDNAATAEYRKATGIPNLVADYKAVDEPLAKIVFCDDNKEHILRAIELLNDHPKADEFDFVRTERTLYEVVPKGVNKGAALPRLAAALGIDMSKVVAIGDYYNDVAMLRAAGLSVAVANAVDEVKAVADYVTVSNEEHAIARVIEELDRGILKL
ncbi:MAG: HAD family phosphatase [Ruminococcaceae bacterium]|nr:HAD family phosphatase [Oscillospiraceae bacterium]